MLCLKLYKNLNKVFKNPFTIIIHFIDYILVNEVFDIIKFTLEINVLVAFVTVLIIKTKGYKCFCKQLLDLGAMMWGVKIWFIPNMIC